MNYALLPVLLLMVMLIIMLMRIILPLGAKVAGKTVKEVRLSFRERVLLQRTNIYAIGTVLLLTTVTGNLSRGWELLVVIVAVMLLMLPVRYFFTTEGIALNNVVYRSWSDFIGYEVRRRGIRLLPQPGFRPFDIDVIGTRREQAITLVRARLHEIPDGRRTTSSGWLKESRIRLKHLFGKSALDSTK
jgi:hypothetical protein